MKFIFHSETWGHVLTPFFGTCQSIGQTAHREWAGAGLGQEERVYWAFGPEEASQLMELWKELVGLRQQVIF